MMGTFSRHSVAEIKLATNKYHKINVNDAQFVHPDRPNERATAVV